MFFDFDSVSKIHEGGAVKNDFSWDFGSFREESLVVMYGFKLFSFEGDGVFYTQVWGGSHITAADGEYKTSLVYEDMILEFSSVKDQRKFISHAIKNH